MSAPIERRLIASLGIDAINGDKFERSVCAAQMREAAREIIALREKAEIFERLVGRRLEELLIALQGFVDLADLRLERGPLSTVEELLVAQARKVIAEAKGAPLAGEHPFAGKRMGHPDGDYSYLCGNDHCRCAQ